MEQARVFAASIVMLWGRVRTDVKRGFIDFKRVAYRAYF
jgi:hypothetical protein